MTAAIREILEPRRPELRALRQQYGVARLDIFESGTTREWERGRSDIDLVVTFLEQPNRSLADRFLGLAEDLERLLGVRVDLLTEDSIRNPYLRRSIDASRTPLYAA